MKDPNCATSISEDDCGFKTTGVTSPANSFFYARGPLGLKTDLEYADFSKAFYEGYDRSSELLDHPDRVSDDGYVGFTSALYKWMVPEKSSPSAHNVMTGFFVPNASDLGAGHKDGFGTTMLIIDGSICGSGTRVAAANELVNKYTSFQADLGMTADT